MDSKKINYNDPMESFIKLNHFKLLENWNSCKEILKTIIPDPFYSHFIEPLYAFYDTNQNVILYVENEKLQKHVEIRYKDIIFSVINNFYKDSLKINNIIFYDKTHKISNAYYIHNTIPSETNSDTKNSKDIWDINLFYPSVENYKELTNLIQLDKYFRPIYIFGPSGSGKTSLAKTWKILHKNNVYYSTIPNFIVEFVNSIKKKKSIEWLETIKNHKILILDDFQFLRPSAIKCMEEIRNLIDYYKDNNKVFILFSDRDFLYLKLEHDLQSRLMTFYKIHLHYPDYNTKIKIIENYCKKYHLNLEDKIIQHLSIKLNGDVRYIQSSIEKLALYQIDPSKLKIHEIDFILEPFYDKSSSIDLDMIIDIVCEYYHVRKEEVLSKNKNKRISYVRHMIAYLAVKLTNKTLSYIAKYLNRNDHTGILYAIKKIEELLNKDLFIREEIEKLKLMIFNKSNEISL